MKKYDIKSMTLTELQDNLNNQSLPKYRTEQIYSWLHVTGVQNYNEMSNLPVDLRAYLIKYFPIFGCGIISKKVSQVDYTVKYLFCLHDDEMIESVLMKYKYGYTLCISTQVGCRMGCKFCATAIGGLIRNLTPSEMLSQIHTVQRDMNIRVSHIVLMGMGEPLDNYQNVIRFLDLVSNEDGLNVGMRNISLSTCGIVPAINMLLGLHLQLTLSVSLHGSNNQIRSKIMPVNQKYSLEELLMVCKKYSEATSRRISFEYAMFEGVNDSEECAIELAGMLKGMLCHVNIIPANYIEECKYKRSSSKTLNLFKDALDKKGINVTMRRSLGSDIDASCGQLRNRQIKTYPC